MSRYYKGRKDGLESSLFQRGDVVALQTSLSRKTGAHYRRELLTQQTLLQNTLDKLFSKILPFELQDDAGVVKVWNDLNQSLIGPQGPKGKAGRQLEELLGDDFADIAALVEDLKGILSEILTLMRKQPEAFVKQAKGERGSADRETPGLERRQHRKTD